MDDLLAEVEPAVERELLEEVVVDPGAEEREHAAEEHQADEDLEDHDEDLEEHGEAVGREITPATPVSELRELCEAVGIAPEKTWVPGKYVEELLEHLASARDDDEVRALVLSDRKSVV